MDNPKTLGKIITFYSYKGGTGRSMALANIAVLAARSGLNTLMIDWDLEAPGLHKYFENKIDVTRLDTTPGLIDLFVTIQNDLNSSTDSLSSDKSKDFLERYNLIEYIIPTSVDNLAFIKAGNFEDNYEEKINTIKWEDIFHKAEDIYFHFGNKLMDQYDLILIDSRTGYTDSSGVCTMILPEKLVLAFTPNRQSLEGVVKLARKAISFRRNSNDLRPLAIYPLPSRIENAEKELRDQWRNRTDKFPLGYQPMFEGLFAELYSLKNIEMTHFFNDAQIQHEAKYAYGEEIAVLNEITRDRLSLSESYNKFFNHLFKEQPIWSIKNIASAKIYISYAHEDRDFSFSLANELRKNGFDVWTDDKLKPGEEWFTALQKAISDSDLFIPIISPEYLVSKTSHFEISAFLEQMRLNELKMITPINLKPTVGILPFNLQSFHSIAIDTNKKNSIQETVQTLNVFLKEKSTHSKVEERTDIWNRLEKMAEDYLSISIADYALRLVLKDKVADGMGQFIKQNKEHIDKEIILNQALVKQNEGLILALAVFIVLEPDERDIERLILTGSLVGRLHVKYRMLIAIKELLRLDYIKSSQFRKVQEMINRYEENADDSLTKLIYSTRISINDHLKLKLE